MKTKQKAIYSMEHSEKGTTGMVRITVSSNGNVWFTLYFCQRYNKNKRKIRISNG